jgi:hypothetical protein
MYLEIIQLVTNTALFILVWLVQLIIYPGFRYYGETELKQWHKLYTLRVSYIIAPLMLTQLIAYGYAVILDPLSSALVILILIVINWGVTFFIAVPLHAKIDKDLDTSEVREKLVRINWLRTVAWTLIFIISLIEYGK